MRATHEDASSKRSSSKKRRRSNRPRRQRVLHQPVLVNTPAVAATAGGTDTLAATAGGTDTLAATAAEQTFFAQACAFPAMELESDDAKPLLLRPEQLERRLWLRRQVTRLMAGLGTFSIIATAIQIASNV